jgi:hypothetical protein
MKTKNRDVLVPAKKLGIVGQGLLSSQPSHVGRSEGVLAEWKSLSIVAMLSKDDQSVPLLSELEHEAGIAVEHHDITLISSVEKDGMSRLVVLI